MTQSQLSHPNIATPLPKKGSQVFVSTDVSGNDNRTEDKHIYKTGSTQIQTKGNERECG